MLLIMKNRDFILVLLFLGAQQTELSIAEDVCNIGEVTATTEFSSISSPDFPNDYPNNTDCTAKITSPINTVIELVFHSFQLEDSEGCANDFLKITSKAGNNLLQPSCGTGFHWPHYPDKIVSRKNDMTIKFTTNDYISDRGFSAAFRAVQPSPQAVVIAQNSSIRMTYRFRNQNIAVTPSNITDPLAVDYDPRTQYIFYSDRGTKTISKFHAERHSFQDVLHSENIGEPLGLRIDVNSRLLYWTDAERGTISVSNLDGEYRNTLVETDLDKPGAIVTEPYEGYIYFTDIGRKPTIERADGDGTNRVILVKTLLISPRSLAIDLKERTLYWIDSSQKYLEKVYYDGTKRTSLKSVSQLDIFALALDSDAFFWSGYRPTEESTGYIYFIDRKLETSGYYVRWGTDKDYKGISLRPYQESGVVIPDTCPAANCSGLCLPKPNGHYRCLAADASPPVFQNCPDTIFVWVAVSESSTFVSWDEILLQDDNDLIASSSHVSGSEFFLGSDTVSIAARDLAGNKAWCNFSVIVYEDEIPPVISPCPDDIYVRITIPGDKEKIVTWNEPELSDNAGKANWLVRSSSSGTAFPIGSTPITYIATDQFGNQAQCSFVVTVLAYVQTTPRPDNDSQEASLTLILVTSFGGVLVVLGLVVLFFKLVLFRGGQRHGRHNSDEDVGTASLRNIYLDSTDISKAPVLSVSGGSV